MNSFIREELGHLLMKSHTIESQGWEFDPPPITFCHPPTHSPEIKEGETELSHTNATSAASHSPGSSSNPEKNCNFCYHYTVVRMMSRKKNTTAPAHKRAAALERAKKDGMEVQNLRMANCFSGGAAAAAAALFGAKKQESK